MRLRKQRPDSGPKRDRTMLYLFWVKDQGQIYLDTSGETISKHGYRKIPYKAPLREALAAAILLSSKWKPGQAFVNPMCGSGTLAIEAAMITMNKAPGLLRSNFGFMHIKGYDVTIWKRLCQEAKDAITPLTGWQCVASDHNLEALRSARINAQQAGVEQWIKFEHKDFRQTMVPPAPGTVIINPEYGDRLGEVERLQNTYQQIGDFFKEKCAGYWGYVFTGNPDLGKQIGLRTKRKLPLFNGQLECRLLEYELYAGSKKQTASMGDKG
jgi:putative N6-adenine-specific DNA methylase